MIFDTHAHYDDSQFDADRSTLLAQTLPQKGVEGIINVASTPDSIPRVLALLDAYDYIYGGVGIHPEAAAGLPADYLKTLSAAAGHPKVVAIGEIGLDYYYEDCCPRDEQKQVFIQQLDLAAKLKLPVILHDRDAHGDMLEILKQKRPQGVLHCFSGSAEMARQVIQNGLYIGLGGVVTFKNARHSAEVATQIPLERLLLETDCPYLSPEPMRGKRNDSSLIAYTAAKIAQLRGITVAQLLSASRSNTHALFGI